MAVAHFAAGADAFEAWAAANPFGFVVGKLGGELPSSLVAHRVVDAPSFIGTEPTACAPKLSELVEWAAREGREVRACTSCIDR